MMAIGEESFDFNVMDERLEISSLPGFDYEEHDFSPWRTDCYGNQYLSDSEYFEVVPELVDADFPKKMKHHLAYLVNLSELDQFIQVPGFEVGLRAEEEGIEPYTVLERPDGRPLSEIPELLHQEEWSHRFDDMNQAGRRLSGNSRIIYPKRRENEDVVVDTDERELVYINPGTYVDQAFYGQFSRSDAVPSNRMQLADWISESFWTEKLE